VSSPFPDAKIRAAIAANIRAEVARAGHRQGDLAVVLGTSRNAVSLKLNSKVAFRAEEIAAIACWLDVPVSDLITADTVFDAAARTAEAVA
jgi:transcriptional regulator with XRE-family HTH domain